MAIIIDYAWGRPSVASLKDAGAVGVARYLSWKPNGKVIDKAEYARLKNAGLDVILVWEYSAQDFINADFNAQLAAHEACAQAADLGHAGPIYYAIDWDITYAQWETVAERLRTVSTVHPVSTIGIYGPWYALDWAHKSELATWFWQAGMSTAWSDGKNRNQWPNAHIRQIRQQAIGGIDCDINEICQSNYGQNGGSTMQLTGPDPWGTGNENEQAAQLRNGFYLLANGYQPSEAGDNGIIARLTRLEHAQADIMAALLVVRDAISTFTTGALSDEQVKMLADQVSSKLEGVEHDAVTAALREVFGSLDE